jgi:hypothetical protein
MEEIFGGRMKDDSAEFLKNGLDALSVVTMLGALFDMLPSIAALFTIVWTGIRIYESDTIQSAIKKFKDWRK